MTLFWDPSIPTETNSSGMVPAYAAVTDVITNEEHPDYGSNGFNVGTIRFKYLNYGGHLDTPQNSFYARPTEISVQEFPLVGEIVMITKLQGIHYYSRRVNVNKTLQLNSLPNIVNRLKPATDNQDRTNTTEQARMGILNQSSDIPEENIGNENYSPKESLYFLKNFDGDVILQNRYGASIRFGSSQAERALNQETMQVNGKSILGPTVSGNNDPLIVMRVGQREIPEVQRTNDSPYALTVEDINLDSTCFVLSENQQINFIFSAPFDTLNQLQSNVYVPQTDSKTVLVGNQTILNSGRLVFNSKENDIVFSTNRDFLVTGKRDVILDTTRNIYLNPTDDNGMIYLGTDVDDTSIDNYLVKFNELEEVLESILTFISTLANQTQYQFPNPAVVSQANSVISNIDSIRSRLVKIKR